MEQQHCKTLDMFDQLQPSEEVELKPGVKVGFRTWEMVTSVKVV